MSDKRTIRITGTGDLRLRPDTTRITMTLEGREGEYAGAVALSAADTEKLKTALAALGFRREEVKTTALTWTRNTKVTRSMAPLASV